MHIYSLNNKHKHTYIYLLEVDQPPLYGICRHTKQFGDLHLAQWESMRTGRYQHGRCTNPIRSPPDTYPILLETGDQSQSYGHYGIHFVTEVQSGCVCVCIYMCVGGVVSCIWVSWRVACVSFI